MGDDQGADKEKPQHTVDLAYPYFIARFPVTVAQWREYVQLSDSRVDDANSLRGRANDPVVSVSWHDAMRFCDFLIQAWVGLLPKGFVVTLPSEAEWEKAARGGVRISADYEWVTALQLTEKLETLLIRPQKPNPFPVRAYPWGESFDSDKANAESTIGETSAVGCYPTGFSPYACEDMSGNVWEWTRSLWGKDGQKPEFKYPYRPGDGRENLKAGDDGFRVLRGGSFRVYPGRVRCVSRSRLLLSFYGGYYYGFRVVVSPISPNSAL
jgi:formylglycine-generating enzyme required for sulfatase activity